MVINLVHANLDSSQVTKPETDCFDSPEVLVSGASGYIAAHIVQQLLQAGYQVRGTVRSLKNEVKVAPLKKLGEEGEVSLHLKVSSNFTGLFFDTFLLQYILLWCILISFTTQHKVNSRLKSAISRPSFAHPSRIASSFLLPAEHPGDFLFKSPGQLLHYLYTHLKAPYISKVDNG